MPLRSLWCDETIEIFDDCSGTEANVYRGNFFIQAETIRGNFLYLMFVHEIILGKLEIFTSILPRFETFSETFKWFLEILINFMKSAWSLKRFFLIKKIWCANQIQITTLPNDLKLKRTSKL